jgi:lipoprotein releasing system transmembrane protein lolC
MNTPFYIALRYIVSKKGSQAVSFITGLAATAMTIAVMAMFIVISIFSGLEELNKELINNIHADLTIKSKEGKLLKNPEEIISVLEKEPEIKAFSKVIEEKVYLNYNENGEIAYLKGVDSIYTQINPIQKAIIYGEYPSFQYQNEVVVEGLLNNRLGIPIGADDDNTTATIFIPKAGEGLINKEEDIFNKEAIFVTGIFAENEQLNNYIIAPIELCQRLLNLPKNSAYQIAIKLNNPEQVDAVKRTLLKNLADDSIYINTQMEENEAFWKMINTEKLIIYLIFILVIFITTFNLAGAIIILQLDKKQQAKSLISLGFTFSQLRKTYFYTGALIVCLGVFFGLILGTLVCILQIQTGFFKASVGLDLPFPVKITLYNYLIVISSAFFFGLMVSWIFSKVNRHHLSSN